MKFLLAFICDDMNKYKKFCGKYRYKITKLKILNVKIDLTIAEEEIDIDSDEFVYGLDKSFYEYKNESKYVSIDTSKTYNNTIVYIEDTLVIEIKNNIPIIIGESEKSRNYIFDCFNLKKLDKLDDLYFNIILLYYNHEKKVVPIFEHYQISDGRYSKDLDEVDCKIRCDLEKMSIDELFNNINYSFLDTSDYDIMPYYKLGVIYIYNCSKEDSLTIDSDCKIVYIWGSVAKCKLQTIVIHKNIERIIEGRNFSFIKNNVKIYLADDVKAKIFSDTYPDGLGIHNLNNKSGWNIEKL